MPYVKFERATAMADLRAVSPAEVKKRLKLFMWGESGTGKTYNSLGFPGAYIIDCERGTENYDKVINAAGSKVFHTTDIFDIIQEVKTLLTVRHEFRTLVIDPITPAYNDLLEKCEVRVGADHGRHYGEANKVMKRLANLIMQLDMNVIITGHAKKEYGDNMKVLGLTFEAWRQIDYWFDLVLELRRDGKGKNKKRMATVRKTRLDAFPDGDSFEFSYDAIKKRYMADLLEKQAEVRDLASEEDVQTIRDLLGLIRLPEGTVDKWFAKAGIDVWEDMPRETIQKCIAYVKSRLPRDKTADDGVGSISDYNDNR
jgi:hypothetical protein